MKSVKNPSFKNKSIELQNYVERIFSDGQWGDLLRSLRNIITHLKPLTPSYEGTEKINEILLNWPTIQERTFDRLCQDMENGMFEMVCEVFPILFDLEWISGPYHANLWENNK